MGLYDRDYASGHEPGFHVQAPKTITTQLVLITAGAYVLQLMTVGFTNWFALYDQWYQRPWDFYRLLTYGFLHDPRDLKHILVNMFIFWMFGRELEQKFGRREYLLFYLWAITFAGFVWSMSEAAYAGNATLVGASGGVAGVVALFALCYPHRKVLLFFVIPMPMWLAASMGLLWDLKIAMTRSGNIAGIAHLAGALCGLYFYKFGFSPFAWIANRFSGARLSRKPKLRLHDPTTDNDSNSGSEIDDRVDEILKKIQEHGQDSLTRRERRILEKASQEYQRKRP